MKPPARKSETINADNGGSDRVDVEAMHAPIMREQQEPRDGYEPVPLWLISVFGGLLFWGGWYVATYSGGFRPDVLDESPEARYITAKAPEPEKPLDPMILGKRLYTANCIACHQANGKGQPGVYPPLAGSEWALGDPGRVKRIVLHGLEGPIQVHGGTYNGNMPSFARLKDEHLAAILTYVRGQSEWGNSASPIAAQSVAATRKATAGRLQPWKAAELSAVSGDDLPTEPSGQAATAPVK